jgi:hypothetical protein
MSYDAIILHSLLYACIYKTSFSSSYKFITHFDKIGVYTVLKIISCELKYASLIYKIIIPCGNIIIICIRVSLLTCIVKLLHKILFRLHNFEICKKKPIINLNPELKLGLSSNILKIGFLLDRRTFDVGQKPIFELKPNQTISRQVLSS